MEKLKINEVIVVEGKYDAVVLSQVVDALILTTGGYSNFTDEETKALIRRLGKTRGVLILTDSDAAGFKIRHHIEMIARG
ncbi:MAG: toprim domain-containing protein, partial [Oscillospiraceae bacterium]